MTTNISIADYLKYANLQMGAEALLNRTDVTALQEKLEKGNGRASLFPTVLAANFAAMYDVLAHKSNTTTGFSGTLFKNKVTNELVLSFRSTEFADDAARDNQETNKMEISQYGWAFGQIADMEAWYAELNADPSLLKDKQFSVTGYSLGGHLATAFNLLRCEDNEESRVLGTYTFNGAGVGQLTNSTSLTAVIQQFDRQRKNFDGQQIVFSDDRITGAFQTLRQRLRGGVAPTAEDYVLAQGAPGSSAEKGLILQAMDRVKTVMAEIDRVAALSNSGLPPASIPAVSVEATTLDYQLAVLLAKENTKAYSLLNAFDSQSGANNTLFNERNVAPDSFSNLYDIYGATYLTAVANSQVGSSRVDLQACKLEYSIVSPK